MDGTNVKRPFTTLAHYEMKSPSSLGTLCVTFMLLWVCSYLSVGKVLEGAGVRATHLDVATQIARLLGKE